MLYTCSVRNIDKLPLDCEVWFIAYSGKLDSEKYRVYNAKELAPSKWLFYKWYQEWRGLPGHLWWDEYSKIFNEHLEKATLELSLLAKEC